MLMKGLASCEVKYSFLVSFTLAVLATPADKWLHSTSS